MKRMTNMLSLLAALAMVLAACGDSDQEATTTAAETPDNGGSETACAVDEVDGDLSFYNWTEYMDPDLIAAFEEEYGVDVIEDFYDSNEAMLAQLQAGASYDVIVPSDYMVGIMIEEGLLLPLTDEAIPNRSNLADEFVNPPYDATGEYTVAYQWGTTGLGVNISIVGEDFEPSWGLVFDTSLTDGYAGGVSLLNDPRETMGAALKYLGYSLNSTSEAELQEAADLIAEAKANITAFDSDQYAVNLVNGETAVGHGYSGGFFSAFADTDDADNWAYVIPEEGGTVWVDNMAVPAVAENPCTAHTFINFLLDAENGAALTNWNYYASPNEAAEEFIDEEVLSDDTIYPSDELMADLEIITDTGDFEINFNDFYQQARS